MSCMHWDHNPLKALYFLIDALQREILEDSLNPTYRLDLSLLQKNLDLYLLKRINTRKILADLGGLRFFYEDKDQLKARNFFSEEAFKGSLLEIKLKILHKNYFWDPYQAFILGSVTKEARKIYVSSLNLNLTHLFLIVHFFWI